MLHDCMACRAGHCTVHQPEPVRFCAGWPKGTACYNSAEPGSSLCEACIEKCLSDQPPAGEPTFKPITFGPITMQIELTHEQFHAYMQGGRIEVEREGSGDAITVRPAPLEHPHLRVLLGEDTHDD